MLKAHDLKQRWQLSTPTICRCRGRRKPRAQPANAKCNLSLPPTCTNDPWKTHSLQTTMRWSSLCAARSLKRSLVHVGGKLKSHFASTHRAMGLQPPEATNCTMPWLFFRGSCSRPNHQQSLRSLTSVNGPVLLHPCDRLAGFVVFHYWRQCILVLQRCFAT